MVLGACSSVANNNNNQTSNTSSQNENSTTANNGNNSNEGDINNADNTDNQNNQTEIANNDGNTGDIQEAIDAAGPFDPNQDVGGFMEGDYDENAVYPIDTNWTRQSRFAGPEDPEEKWTVELIDEEYSNEPGQTTPVIGSDGTIYAVTNSHDEEYDGLHAITPDGEIKWQATDYHKELDVHSGDYHRSPPIISKDGNIWTRINNDLFAQFDSETGDLNDTFEWESNLGVGPDPTVIGEDNTFYIDNGGMFGVMKDGDLQWQLGDETNYSEYVFYGPPAVAEDGTIYGIEDEHFYAIDEDGEVKWDNDVIGAIEYSNIQIDKEGNVYFIKDSIIYSYTKDGEERWEEDTGSEYFGEQGTILTNDDTLIALFEDGLHAYDLDGNEEWHYEPEEPVFEAPIADSEGTTYIRSHNAIYAVDKDGELKWEYKPEDASEYSNIAIGPNNTLYFFTHKGRMIALGDK